MDSTDIIVAICAIGLPALALTAFLVFYHLRQGIKATARISQQSVSSRPQAIYQ